MPPKSLSQKASFMDKRIGELLSQMTLREKVDLLAGCGGWALGKVGRLGIEPLKVMDGPHGVRTIKATAFPSGVSMAATWNTSLIGKVGKALAEETRDAGYDILLGPCVNIARVPLAGRNFEAYSEDPYLNGRLGVAYVNGIQSMNVGTSLKHFACNNQEHERGRGSSVVDERTLREIYLPHFEMIVKEAKPWTVMCSYNRINGVHASQNRYLLTDILRNEWGYQGIVVSDWGAVHNTRESAAAGMDVEMPGPAKFRGGYLVEIVDTWQLEEEAVNRAARNYLRLLITSGKLDGKRPVQRKTLNSAAHQQLARTVAEEAITLLKNDRDLLPLDVKHIRSIAVIGPNADRALSGGGSSWVDPPYAVSPLDGLRKKLGKRVTVKYERGCDNYVQLPLIAKEQLIPFSGKGNGLTATYYNNSDLRGKPVCERIIDTAHHWLWNSAPMEGVEKERWSARYSGTYVSPADGYQKIELTGSGKMRLLINGKQLAATRMPDRFRDGSNTAHVTTEFLFEKGKRYSFAVEYVKIPDEISSLLHVGMGRSDRTGWGEEIQRAADLASLCDVTLVFAGLPDRFETEGRDRPHMDLTGQQDELIRAVVRANPRTIVVINAGAPVTMPWIDEVPAVVLSYYPGMEGGNAVADILTGAINPSGKLPVTFPKRHEDTPGFINYPGTREVMYGEGLFVGYRYYEKKDVAPLFPFGHGLSYTKFEYRNLRVPARLQNSGNMSAVISLDVKNAGPRAGAETIQLYISDKASSLVRPLKELKGFAKVYLKPGETKQVRLSLDKRSFAFYDPYRKEWIAEAGEFEILVGGSSQDIRLRGKMVLV